MNTFEGILKSSPSTGTPLENQGFFTVIITISRLLLFLFTTAEGLVIVGFGAIGLFVMRFMKELHTQHLLALGTGKKFSVKEGLFLFFSTLVDMAERLVMALPTLLLLAGLGLSFVAIGKTVEQVDAVLQAQRRIRELQTVVKHLEGSFRVAELTVHSTSGGIMRFSVDFYNPAHPTTPAEHREFELPGQELFIDAIVCNFDYSEIAAGRKINLAIPYRLFSDVVPQVEGIPLGGLDARGVPYMYYRSDEDIYGIAPAIYRERLVELMELLRSDSRSRPAGIVRSLYGSAIHKRVSAGSRYEIRVEQTGGLTLKEKFPF
ncbi:MAG: hypothetical protein WHT84_02815 [Breznakiellaceae bacterium]